MEQQVAMYRTEDLLTEGLIEPVEGEVEVETVAEKPGEALKGVSKTQLGLNNDVDYEGKTLHVQTEDLGSLKAKIVTHVFHNGQILFSSATDYNELQNIGDMKETVRERVKWQHRVVMAGISSGKLKEKINL
jgi:hypothetical protein